MDIMTIIQAGGILLVTVIYVVNLFELRRYKRINKSLEAEVVQAYHQLERIEELEARIAKAEALTNWLEPRTD